MPDGWWRDRAGAAARLLARLDGLPRDADVGSVVVVLEGAARAAAGEGRHGTVDVRHAAGAGDDLLAGLCAPGVLLVTADRELRARAQARGAGVAGPHWLLDRLPAS